MFSKKVIVKIKKDKKYLEYIKIIRQYDNSISMTQIKDAIEKDEVVFAFDPSDNHIIHNGKDNSSRFREEIFVKTLKLLKRAGADMVVMEGERECIEFSKVTSSKENVNKLIEKLNEAQDGSAALDTIEKLKKAAKKGESNRKLIIEAIINYTKQTQLSHLRPFFICGINDIVKEDENQYEEYYKSIIERGDCSESYFAIKGYAKVMQKSSYAFLADTLLSRKLDMECEALIVQEISKLSNQPFDEGSPYEWIEWKEKNLRLAEIEKWKNEGFPDGEGYKDPIVHKCLLEPISSQERLYVELDNKLKQRREKNKDKGHPAFWLIQADADDIERIKEILNPPSNYMDFLEKASPLNVEMKLKDYGLVLLYGAKDLIDGQTGYSFISEDGNKSDDWPENYIVIATCDSDPFCIDASKDNSPVYYSMHGMGEWDFDEAFDSFADFLKALK